MTDLLDRIPESHTPGPWHVQGQEIVGQVFAIAYMADNDEDADADACLIALAPELATALREAHARIAAATALCDKFANQDAESNFLLGQAVAAQQIRAALATQDTPKTEARDGE